MGVWGIKPFQNDSVLDDMGMFQFADELVTNIEKYLRMKRNYYPGYEFTALLVSTYMHGAKQHFMLGENKILSIMSTLDKDVLTKEEKDLFYENSKLWTSACSIPLKERKELLKKCANKLKNELDDPRTGKEYFEKDEFILCMKHVYTTAQEILNSVNNRPAYISKERFERLLKAYDKDDCSSLLICCVDKIYKGNKIIAYVIEDQYHRRNEVMPEQLKDAIRNKTVECTNLTLTSDNRLISK